MSVRDNGGSAFPLPIAVGPSGDVYHAGAWSDPGMTLRDWFAGQVIAGLVNGASSSAFSMAGLLAASEDNKQSIHALTAEAAYHFADAMLVERAKGGAS